MILLMNKTNWLKVENYFEAFLLIFLLGLFFYVIKGYLFPILLAAALVFLSYKFHAWLLIKLKNETFSALIVLFIVIVIILFPTYWVINSLLSDVGGLLVTGQNVFENLDYGDCSHILCGWASEHKDFLQFGFEKIVNKLEEFVYSSLSSIFTSVADFLLSLFVFVFAFFFLLKDGEKFARYVKRIIPMKAEYKNALFLRFRDVTRAVFVNTIFVAILQGTLTGLGLWFVGVPSPVFWGLVASFAALLPIFGPSLVWGPAVVYLLLTGHYFGGLFLLGYGVLFVGLIDNMIAPFLLNKKLEVHEFLILISILGGIEVFGFLLGIFLGPMIVAFLVSILHLYNLDFD